MLPLQELRHGIEKLIDLGGIDSLAAVHIRAASGGCDGIFEELLHERQLRGLG